MAEIVLAIGTSQRPLLASQPEDYVKYAEINAKDKDACRTRQNGHALTAICLPQLIPQLSIKSGLIHHSDRESRFCPHDHP